MHWNFVSIAWRRHPKQGWQIYRCVHVYFLPPSLPLPLSSSLPFSLSFSLPPSFPLPPSLPPSLPTYLTLLTSTPCRVLYNKPQSMSSDVQMCLSGWKLLRRGETISNLLPFGLNHWRLHWRRPRCVCMCVCVVLCVLCVCLRHIIFEVFMSWPETTKIKHYLSFSIAFTGILIANRISVICKNCFCEILEIAQSMKIVHLKYMMYLVQHSTHVCVLRDCAVLYTEHVHIHIYMYVDLNSMWLANWLLY